MTKATAVQNRQIRHFGAGVWAEVGWVGWVIERVCIVGGGGGVGRMFGHRVGWETIGRQLVTIIIIIPSMTAKAHMSSKYSRCNVQAMSSRLHQTG
jgi:hypothetical protein